MFTPKVLKGQLKKLKLRWRGPYCIMELHSPLVYMLQHQQNPKDVQITHISHLKPHCGGDTIDEVNETLKYTYPQVEEMVDLQERPAEAEQKEIEAVLAHRRTEKNEFEFRVRYRGFTTQHNKWVHEHNMKANALLKRYWQTLQLRHSTRSKQKSKNGQ